MATNGWCAEDPRDLGPDQRRQAIAQILASGLLRLHGRSALAVSGPASPASPDSAESGPNCFEVSGKTVLSVHTG
jgi:hypothetical protein